MDLLDVQKQNENDRHMHELVDLVGELRTDLAGLHKKVRGMEIEILSLRAERDSKVLSGSVGGSVYYTKT